MEVAEIDIDCEEQDEKALQWAALERLPTIARIRRAITRRDYGNFSEVDVSTLNAHERSVLINRLLDQFGDPEQFFQRIRQRYDAVNLQYPKVEVRFQNLKVDAYAYIGIRALPTIYNYVYNMAEDFLSHLKVFPITKKKLSILNNVSGIVRPSRLTLILGPPSSGKTTLLLALAGRLNSSLQKSGTVTYNGQNLNEFVPQRTSAYFSQTDCHVAELTVRETLGFSSRCQGVGIKYELLMELLRREKDAKIRPCEDIDIFMKALALEGKDANLELEFILKILGLEACADTLVGDEMIKGISGGQKKRLTIGELLVGSARVLAMDEISTGLDSLTTYQIIKYLKHSNRAFDGTTIISLLQPSLETFELFDDIMLISEGHIVYQGPRVDALNFFEAFGFRCPERKNVADFLQEILSKNDQQQHWISSNRPYQYLPVAMFSEGFRSSDTGKRLNEEIDVPYNREDNHLSALSTSVYGIKRFELLKENFLWQLLLMKRNSFIYIFKLIQLFLISLLTMTVFFRSTMHRNNESDGYFYFAALYFATITILFNGFTEVALLVAKLPVLYKHRDLNFYPSWAYVIPAWILSIPTSFMESAIWVAVTYYTIGYDPHTSRFFYQFLLLFCLHQMSIALFHVIASLGRNMIISNTFGSFAMLVIMLLGGFIISKNSITLWWIWGYWISPLMYVQNAGALNEFLGHSWDKSIGNNNATLGKATLTAYGMFTKAYWFWIGVCIVLAYIVILNVLFSISLANLNPLGSPQVFVSKDEVEEEENMRKESAINVELKCAQMSGKEHKGMILPFQPLTMCFHNLNYFVDIPTKLRQEGVEKNRSQLLFDVTGAFKPGVLTALVGVSGAGKTTLMDVLAGRKTGGLIEGNITISGHPIVQKKFARVCGYCEQMDIHSPCLTIVESLLFSAWLRLNSNVSLETRNLFVKEIMDLVELKPLGGALVGLPRINGLSVQQRKRLTIAVELVANPSIVFMDEPTSGLDARSAAIVMRTVRNIVNTGRTIVCTIHQPSIDIFESFDELLFMKLGGELIYSGPLGSNCLNLIEFFEAIPRLPKIKDGVNPADWMLEVTSPQMENQLGVNFADYYRSSELHQQNKELVQNLSMPDESMKELCFPTEYSQQFVTQYIACLWKLKLSYWRNPQYTAVRFFFTLIISLMFGTICWGIGSKRETQHDILNAMGTMYAAILFIGVTNAMAVQPVVFIERLVSYRERASKMYAASSLAYAMVTIEFPYVLVQTIIYSIIFYSMASFELTAQKFLYFIFFMYFTLLYFTFFGMMTSAITPGLHVAPIMAGPFFTLWNLYSGFLIPYKRIPAWSRWFYWANPMAWSLYGLLTSQFQDIEKQIKLADGVHSQSVKDFLETNFGFKNDLEAIAGIMVVIFCAMFALSFSMAIKHLSFQRR